MDPRVTVVVVTYDAGPLLAECLASLGDTPVLVVDNGASPVSLPGRRVLRTGRNLGFAGGANLGLRAVTTPYAALLNDDAVAAPGWLDPLVAVLDADPSVGAVQAKVLLAESGRVNSAGGVLLPDWTGADRGMGEPDDGRYDEACDVDFASGSAVLYRLAAVREAGYFDEDYFLYYEDVDLSLRMRRLGWRIRYEPASVVRHRHGASAGRVHPFYDARNRLLTLVKHAPAPLALREVLRFPLTTASLYAKRRDGDELRTRLRAYRSFLALAPRMARRRTRRVGGNPRP